MSHAAQQMYAHAEDALKDMDVGDLPVSPIDAIRNVIQKAGYSVREITGRDKMLDYSGDVPVIVNRPASEVGASGKKMSVKHFNDGKLDSLIINKSGSTGISLHASSKFRDQRRRRMVIAEADPNIDTHMQMLGRAHRTGQVIAPAYTHLSADIPAEVRPTAVLMRKMASLNANTTGAAKSRFTADATDFLNKYGDRVVLAMMEADPYIHSRLGLPLGDMNTDGAGENAAAKVTGRLTLLEPQQQQILLDEISRHYKDLIAELDAAGENDLEAKSMDLGARVLSSEQLKAATGSSPFQGPVDLEKVSIKSQGRAMGSPEVANAIASGEGGDFVKDMPKLAMAGREKQDGLIERTRKATIDHLSHYLAVAKDEEGKK
jgi:hypothetical protein